MGSESRLRFPGKRCPRKLARERAERLIKQIETGRLDVSKGIAKTLRIKALASDTSTDLDVLAEVLQDSDEAVRADAARCIDFLACNYITLDRLTSVPGRWLG